MQRKRHHLLPIVPPFHCASSFLLQHLVLDFGCLATMAPPTWATKDQTVFLTGHVPLYETYQATTKKYQPFWDMVNAEFLEKWPILAPEVNAQDLTEGAFQEYSKELAKLYKVRQVLTHRLLISQP